MDYIYLIRLSYQNLRYKVSLHIKIFTRIYVIFRRSNILPNVYEKSCCCQILITKVLRDNYSLDNQSLNHNHVMIIMIFSEKTLIMV